MSALLTYQVTYSSPDRNSRERNLSKSCVILYYHSSFFRKNQQFITWDMVVDHDSCNVTTYIRQKKRKGKRKKKERKRDEI